MKFLSAALTISCALAVLLFAPRATTAQSPKWKYQTNAGISASAVLGPDGTLYVGSGDNIYAIVTVGSSSVAAGSLKWSYATGGAVQSSAVLGPDGTLYVGSNDFYIYAIVTVGSNAAAANSHDGIDEIIVRPYIQRPVRAEYGG